MRLYKKIRSLILNICAAALLITTSMPFTVMADGDDYGSSSETSADKTSSDELLIAGFGTSLDGFKRSDNVRAIEQITTSDGERECLEVVGYDVSVDLVRKVTADFGSVQAGNPGTKKGLDLTEYQGVSYDVYVPAYEADPDAEYFVQMTLRAADGSSTGNITKIQPDNWTTVGFEIASWRGRSDLLSAEITLTVSTVESGLNRNTFFIDEFRADNRVNHDHTDRFMIDDFTCSGGGAAYNDLTKRLNITMSDSEPTVLSAVVFPNTPSWSVNSLRLRIANDSDADSLTVFYSTYDTDALSEDKSVTLKLDRQSELKSYYIDVGDISKLRSLRLQLEEGAGSVSIASICPVSRYIAPKFQTCGNITGCYLTDDLLSLRFTGDIGREEALSNQSGTLCVYATEPGTDPETLDISSLTPIVQSPMTTKFDLSADPESVSEELFTKQFVAFSVREDGSRALVDAPFCLDDIGRAAKNSVTGEHGVKGVVVSDISLLGELRADVTMLTVDATKAFASRGKGESFVYRGSNYYIDTDYFAPLDRQIGALHGAGVSVILRLTGWSEDFESTLSERYGLTTDYAEYNTTPDGSDFLAALGGYIGENFCSDGSVTGVVIGECENFIGLTDGRYESLNAMAEGLSLALRRLRNGLMSANSETKVYLSISNLYSNELAASTSEIGADELLPALCGEINLYGGFEWGICVEDFYRMKDYGDSLVSALNCNELVTLLRSAGVYDTRMLFCDTNYAFSQMKLTEKITRVVESYLAACFNSHIDAVICTLPDKSVSTRLSETVRMLDTSGAEEISALALSISGHDSWKEIIEGYDEHKLKQKTLETGTAVDEPPGGIKGRYGYFRFDSFSGVNGIEPSFYCRSMSVGAVSAESSDGTENAVLSAGLSPDSGTAAWMGVAHRFSYPENMKLTPILELNVGIDASGSEAYGAKLILIAGAARFESDFELIPGETRTVYADISGFSGIEDVESIQVLVEGRSEVVMKLGWLNGLSKDYNDESLESVIIEERTKKRTPDIDDGYRNYVWIGGGVIVGTATILTVMLLSRKREDGDE